MLSLEYTYPFDLDWTKDEIIHVITFFQQVEKAYETGVKRESFMKAYRNFKKVVPSIAEEKKMDATFEKESGYSSYRALQEAKRTADGDSFRIK